MPGEPTNGPPISPRQLESTCMMLAVLLSPSSYLGIIAFLVLTGCGLPIPEEVAFVVAGVLSAEGSLHWPTALASCLVGSILGDSVMYAIGRRWGETLLGAHPRLAWILHAKREKQFELAVQQHAFKVMFLSRFLVGIRGPVYVAAGAVHVPYLRFLVIDIFCASLVVTAFFSLAYFFGDSVLDWIRDAEITATIAVLLIVVGIGLVVYIRSRRKITEIVVGEPEGSQEPGAGSQE
jgi:membrane protein DedA with SNARE-associated domain